jgi:hypothetical protein
VSASEEGRLKMSLERFVQQTIPGIDYFAEYPGTIISQSGQTFDFLPDSTKVPGIQGLSFYSGSPGITFTVDTSQSPRAVLFFGGGVPSGAAISCWGNPGLATLQIGGSGPAAARVGDTVTIALDDLLQFTWTVAMGVAVPTGSVTGPKTAISSGSSITSIA